MRTRLLYVSTVLLLLVAGIAVAGSAGATGETTTPKCKAGQKSTKAHPCMKVKVAAKTTKPKPKTTTTKPVSSSSGSATPTPSPAANTGAGAAPPDMSGCPAGQTIPQNAGGDGDDDNQGGGDDGDGCI